MFYIPLVSSLATCFWDGRSCMCNEVWKVWEGGQSVCTTLKEFRGYKCSFAQHRTRGYGCFWRQPHALFASLGTAALSRTHRSRCGLHSAVAAFTLCLLFSFRARLLAFVSSLSLQFLPFQCCDNEIADAATALRTINLCKCIQIFVNRIFRDKLHS